MVMGGEGHNAPARRSSIVRCRSYLGGQLEIIDIRYHPSGSGTSFREAHKREGSFKAKTRGVGLLKGGASA